MNYFCLIFVLLGHFLVENGATQSLNNTEFTSPGNDSNPKNHFLLVAQKNYISIYNFTTKTLEKFPLKSGKRTSYSITADFDMKNNCIYWSDAKETNHFIVRQCSQEKPEFIVSSPHLSIEGMALDWISNNLYFVDSRNKRIQLIRTDNRMNKTILQFPETSKPRGIALHPVLGYIFWTDWSSESPSVNRADLDGTNVKKLFGEPQVKWPNHITVDFLGERIYWAEAGLHQLCSSDFDGGNFRKFSRNIKHPYGITVFRNFLYWNDWRTKTIYKADTLNVDGYEEVSNYNLESLYDLKSFGKGVQEGTNACVNTSCKFICVGKPQNQSVCLCPDDVTSDGECLHPISAANTEKQSPKCASDQFTCKNSRCILKNWVCDSEDDCFDGSDEENCPPKNCTYREFPCSDGNCVYKTFRCDGDNDCPDASDELNCPQKTCQNKEQFFCGPPQNQCVLNFSVCDGKKDCFNGLDEENCGNKLRENCSSEYFTCEDGTCIPMPWKCDNEKDCFDGSDEINCFGKNCTEEEFTCGDGNCISVKWKCDGQNNCEDGSDEFNCPKSIQRLLKMKVSQINESSILLRWHFPYKSGWEFMPSVKDENGWKNTSWTDQKLYRFTQLEAFTKYNFTVYLRKQNTTEVFPPVKYLAAYTKEGVPSPPWNVTVLPRNETYVLVSWNQPKSPKGVVIKYQIYYSPPFPPKKINVNRNETKYLLRGDFQSNVEYSFYMVAYNSNYESDYSELAKFLLDGVAKEEFNQ